MVLRKAKETATVPIILVVGAGPKAIALATKAAVLTELGILAPTIVVIEREHIGANWTGKHGFTDGSQLLWTPGSRDIGFPYKSRGWSEELNVKVADKMRAYSWQRYQVVHEEYADWVNRGRPHPSLNSWAKYLQWVADNVGINVRIGFVNAITRTSKNRSKWKLSCKGKDTGRFKIEGDGLVITGPGNIVSPPRGLTAPRYLDLTSVWRNLRHFKNEGLHNVRICIVGSGELAANIASRVLEIIDPSCRITIVLPEGFPQLHAENYYENRFLSAPDDEWRPFSQDFRRDYMRKVGGEIHSRELFKQLTGAANVGFLPGEMTAIANNHGLPEIVVSYAGRATPYTFEYVIDTTNFDPLWFVRILDRGTRMELNKCVGTINVESLEDRIDESLAVEGMKPLLHLPMLAGVRQGPGFPSLHCLGLLADRILTPYLDANSLR